MSTTRLAASFPSPGLMRAAGIDRWVVLAFVCSLCATLWAFTRFPMAGALHGWASQHCVRFEMAPADWPCQVTMGRSLAVYLTASALVSLAALLPAVVLAQQGRRILAFIPMVAPLSITFLAHAATWAWSGHWVPLERTTTPQLLLGPWAQWTVGGAPGSVWRPDDPVGIGADLVLLATPVIAAIVLLRPRRAPRSGFSLRFGLLAFGLAAGASAIVELGAHRIMGAEPYLEGGWYLQGFVMILFGLLLPVGPRRPLWTIPLVACLLSFGGPAAIAGSLYGNGLTTFTFFRSALPLTLMGYAAAAATAFVARQRGLTTDVHVRPKARFRPITVGYGLAVATVAIGTVMAALDPLPYALSTSLPTYLGARERVTDLRARITLDEALDAASRYRASEGSFEGFDARAGREADPSLLWVDGIPPSGPALEPELTVRVLPAEEDRLRLVLVGPVTTYCVTQTLGAPPTYGVAHTGRAHERAIAATATCGDRPWEVELLRPFPVDALCDGAPDILLCRIVQQHLREVLASPTGIG